MAQKRVVRDMVAKLSLDTTPAEQAYSRVQGTLFKTTSSTRQLQGGLAAINAEFARMGPLGNAVSGLFGNIGSIAPRASGQLELNAAKWGLLGEKTQAAAYGLNAAEASAASAEGVLPALGGAVTGVAVGAAGVAAAFQVARSSVDAFVSAAEPVEQLQRVTGATAQQASILAYSFKSLGIDADTGGSALFRLGKNVDGNAEKLAQLGVQVQHNRDGSVDLVGTLNELADAYQANGDAAQRDQLLVAAFGRGGAALAPLLAQGSAGLKDFTDQAKAAGLVFDQQQLEQARQYAIQTHQLGLEFQGLQVKLGEGVLPEFVKLADDADKVAQAFQSIGDHVPDIGGAVAGVAGSIVGPIGPLIDLLNKLPGGTKPAAAGTKDLATSMDDAATSAQKEAAALQALYSGYVGGAQAQLAYGQSQQTIAGLADEYAQKQLNVKTANQAVKDAQKALNEAISDGAPKAARANKELQLAQDALNAAIKKYGPTSDQAERASLRVSDAQDALNKVLQGYGPNSEAAAKASDDLAAAQLRARDAARQLKGDLNAQEGEVLNTALAYVAQQKALKEAEGGQYSAKQSAQDLVTGLEQVRKELDPNDPLRKNLDAYIDQLENGIPPSVTTTITAKVTGDYLAPAQQRAQSALHFAGGGDYAAGRPRITGEAGPELDVPNMSGHVFDARTTALLANAVGSSGGGSRGIQVDQLQIYNPVPVATQQMISEALLRASFLLGD